MSLISRPFYTYGSVTTVGTPTNILGNNIQLTAIGGNAFSGAGAYIVATAPISVFPIDIVVGTDVNSGPEDGGDGLSGGGGAGVNTHPGGGSSGVVTSLGSTPVILIEAGGADAGYDTGNPSNPSLGPTGFGGTGGGFSTDGVGGTIPADSTFYSPGGSGGAAGGDGGAGSVNVGDVFPGHGGGSGYGTSGATNGQDSLCIAGFTTYQYAVGVGSGGLPVLNKGACFASNTVISYTYGNQDGQNQPAQVVLSYHVADAPNAPIPVPAIDGAPSMGFVDSQNATWEIDAIYNAPSPDTGVLAAVQYAFTSTFFVGTQYWDGLALTSTPSWVTPTTGLGIGNGGRFTLTVPAGIFPDGGTVTFAIATQESFAELQGPASSGITITTVSPPVVTITSPAPGAIVTTLGPTIDWSIVSPSVSPNGYSYLLTETATGQTVMGPTTVIHTPTFVSGHNWTDTFNIPSPTSGPHLNSINTYTLELIETTALGVYSVPVYLIFTVQLTLEGYTVALAGEPWFDPTNDIPAPYLELTATGSGSTLFAQFQADYAGGDNFQDIYQGNPTTVTANVSIHYDDFCPFNQLVAYRARVLTTVADGGYGAETYAGPWSNTVALMIPSINWWIVCPSNTGLSLELHRLPTQTGTSSDSTLSSPATPTMPGGLSTSLLVDEEEQLGTFRPFGKSNAVLVHGEIWAYEFDLNVYFYSPAEWNDFRAIRNMKSVVLLKSDMEGQTYWVTLGSDLNPGIPSETSRQENPTRALTVHCIPTDPPALP